MDKQEQLYLLLSKIPFFSKYVEKFKNRYKLSYPALDSTAKQYAATHATLSVVFGILSAFIWFLINSVFCGMTFFTYISPILMFYLVKTEVEQHFLYTASIRFNKDFYSYILEVARGYQSKGKIVPAILEAADYYSKNIKDLSHIITDMITAENAFARIHDFTTNPDNNAYLKLFVSKCYDVFENGNTVENEFVIFIETLRMDIFKANQDKEVLHFKLQGYGLAIWLPTLCMGFIRRGGSSFSQDMLTFYIQNSTVLEIIGVVLSFFAYTLLNQTQNPMRYKESFRRFYYTIQDTFGMFNDPYYEKTRLTKLFRRTGCNIPASVIYTKLSVDAVSYIFAGYTAVFVSAVLSGASIPFSVIPLCLLFGLLTFVTVIRNLYASALFKQNKDTEISIFQLILIANKDIITTNMISLVERIEQCSAFYKPVITEFRHTLAFNREKAFDDIEMYARRTDDKDFNNVISMLRNIDSVGLKNAMSTAETDRNIMREEKNLKRSIKQDNRKNLIQMVSYVPAGFVLFFFFVGPFLLQSLQGVGNIFDAIELLNKGV